MAVFWLELHCENSPGQVDGCVNSDHSYHMGGTEAPGQYSIQLKAEARRAGWKYIRDIGFCCKACVTKWEAEGL